MVALGVLLAAEVPPAQAAAAAVTVTKWTSLSTAQASVQKNIVDLHNQLRRGVSPAASNMLQMSWNKQAANNSLNWAKSCALGHSASANRKTPVFGCGENLYIGNAPFTWKYVIGEWYNEVTAPGFVYDKAGQGAGVEHYTQLVWYSSFQIGCSVNFCATAKKYFYVCHYCPAGNLNTRVFRPYDKGSACTSCPKSCVNKLCVNPCMFTDYYSTCAQMKATYGCSNSTSGKVIQKNCPASCYCDGKIH
ncbi:serotriflin-like [Petromyzon marinus]|uniref:serotriflin-like n=1 Tax=Petromyzon marinus TaxID=7757 RepID=UPI003F72139A